MKNKTFYLVIIVIITVLLFVWKSRKKVVNKLTQLHYNYKQQLVNKNIEIECLIIKNKDENYQIQQDYNQQLEYKNEEIECLRQDISMAQKEIEELANYKNTHEEDLKKLFESNITAIPYLAGMMADYLTYDIEILAKKLDWGSNIERAKKVVSIREIRADAQQRIEEAKVAIYQLEYLKSLYPALSDVIDSDYRDYLFKHEIPEYDPIREFISKDDWNNLSDSEKNQKALDNYIASHKKTKWQIGRDYELYIGYKYQCNGFEVDYFGSNMGLEDLGRDVIVKKNGKIKIIQCKYWSQNKTIHEKHIFQLYGTLVEYCISNGMQLINVEGVFVTNIYLSDMAQKVAKQLGIVIIQNHETGEYPRIKCNIGRDEFGDSIKIYHLPMDQQYDSIKVRNDGGCFAYTVTEAESMGFRRAYKWYGN